MRKLILILTCLNFLKIGMIGLLLRSRLDKQGFLLTNGCLRLCGILKSRTRRRFVITTIEAMTFTAGSVILFLILVGPMMIYTSGILGSATKYESLESMQQRKLETVCKKIDLKPNDRLLDIGCGWGTLCVHAASKGAKATGITLGRNQHQWATSKAKAANVSDKVEILCMDYRDIPARKYDKITCLEMAEHVGVLRFSTFLSQVREMLEDDGLFFLQIAGLRRAWQYEDLQWGVISIC